jgi:hypothetical protein
MILLAAAAWAEPEGCVAVCCGGWWQHRVRAAGHRQRHGERLSERVPGTAAAMAWGAGPLTHHGRADVHMGRLRESGAVHGQPATLCERAADDCDGYKRATGRTWVTDFRCKNASRRHLGHV